MVAAAAIPTPIPKPNKTAAFVDPQTGALSEHGATLMQKWHGRHVGTARMIPCDVTGTNVISLTPVAPSPTLEKYDVYDRFTFAAANTSTGAVTATVVPTSGTLSTLKVFKSDGASQAGAGDVVANSVYDLIYAPHLDSSAGGFVLK